MKLVLTISSLLVVCIFNNATAQTKPKPLTGKVSLEKLSNNAKDYIAENYKGYKIKKAEYDPLCSGGDAIDVSITKQKSKTYSLIFLLDGTFIQQETDVPFSEAPIEIGKALKIKYADYTYSKQIEKLQLADKSIQYLVDISKGFVSKEVIFDAQGVVICEN